MAQSDALQLFQAELEAGLKLTKCQQCGCLENTLKALATALTSSTVPDSETIAGQVSAGLQQMRPVRYACLGCEHCYPAVAQNALIQAFPELDQLAALSCDFQVSADGWPPVVGEYKLVDPQAPVAVSTLGSPALAEELAGRKPAGLAIVGKTETENIGLDKIVKNIVANPSIRFLVVAGAETQGHQSGRTLVALAENGVNAEGRVLGSPGKRPVLRNVTAEEIAAFRQQVQVIDLIGCEDPAVICARVEELSHQVVATCGCSECAETASSVSVTTLPTLVVSDPDQPVVMDKAGYFVILPLEDKGTINVEHYSYDNTLLHVVEGPNARALYFAIVGRGWVIELSHAAYLGKELAKAELSLQHRFTYLQDGA
jgi:tetrahydromethanopterin S-methyltransferase subunit A